LLHKTLAEIEVMSMAEYQSWNVFFEERVVLEQRERNRAAGIIDFTDPNASRNLIALVESGGGSRK
jgi:hypothetical protein